MKWTVCAITIALCLALTFSAVGCIPKDYLPPNISGVTAVSSISSSATISWITDESATSQVEYGTTIYYGSSSVLDSNLVTSHEVKLAGLTSGATYYYEVTSKDASGNETDSGIYQFTAYKDYEDAEFLSWASTTCHQTENWWDSDIQDVMGDWGALERTCQTEKTLIDGTLKPECQSFYLSAKFETIRNEFTDYLYNLSLAADSMRLFAEKKVENPYAVTDATVQEFRVAFIFHQYATEHLDVAKGLVAQYGFSL